MQVLAAWGDHMGRGWWWVMGLGWIVFLLVVAAAVVVLARRRSGPAEGKRSAEEILAERFARGELTEDEYRSRRALLRD